jgi:transcriptional regulator with XRE-family HTH domain
VTSIQHAREALGGRLREVRRRAGLTGRQLAGRLGWAPSKVSKLENGRQAPTDDDIRGWCSVCGADGERELGALLASLHSVESRHAEWRRVLRGGASGHQGEITALDARTRVFRAFEISIVPGLLQVDSYARAIFTKIAAAHDVPRDIHDAVTSRMARQPILYDPAKRFHFVIAEAALRYRLCPPEVMLAQLDRLMSATALAGVRIGIIPDRVSYRVIPSHGFWILDDKLVMVETISAELNLTQSQEIELYSRTFAQLAGIAVYGGQARAIITAVIDELRTGSGGEPGNSET